MSDLYINSKKIGVNRTVKSKKRDRNKKYPSLYQFAPNELSSENVYAKAVQDYEEFKRISNPFKNNLHESRDESNSLTIKGDPKVKSIDPQNLNNGGRSVLTYKKLVSCMKSPYISGGIIENLNKAYYPSKIKKGKHMNKRKKKSSTPNIKVRKFQKDYIPIRIQQKLNSQDESAELERLRFLKQREEYEILLKQRHNIQKLKDYQNGVVPENDNESDTKSYVESKIHTTQQLNASHEETKEYKMKPNQTIDVYLNPDEQDLSENQDEMQADEPDDIDEKDNPFFAASDEINGANNEVLIHDSDDENQENDYDYDPGDNYTPSKDKDSKISDSNIFANRSKSDQVDEIPDNFAPEDGKEATPSKGSKVKKGKTNKNIPKTIKRIFPNVTDLNAWRKRNHLEKKTRIFKMFGNYASIRKALHDRGWVENKDKVSF